MPECVYDVILLIGSPFSQVPMGDIEIVLDYRVAACPAFIITQADLDGRCS